jgi:hypothetical protein
MGLRFRPTRLCGGRLAAVERLGSTGYSAAPRQNFKINDGADAIDGVWLSTLAPRGKGV